MSSLKFQRLTHVGPFATINYLVETPQLYKLKTNGNGSIKKNGTFKTLKPEKTRPNVGASSSAVMYAPGKIIQVGGNGYSSGDDTTSSKHASLFDINNMPNVKVKETSPMHFPRQWADACVLPDGQVWVSGGSTKGNRNGANAVKKSEIWSPATGKWKLGPSAAIYRGYHSRATQLTNGALLTSGGGASGRVVNFNSEVYYPRYLFQKSGGKSVCANALVLQVSPPMLSNTQPN